MVELGGLRIAVLGLGRSGIAVALAAQARGAETTLFDQQTLDSSGRFAEIERLQAAGIAVETGWHGRLTGSEFDIVVSSPGFRREHPALRDAQQAGAKIWSEIEFAYAIAKAPILAITGTNGKSTTTVMTWLMVREVVPGALLCGNIHGSGYPELTLTEAADQAGPEDALIAEVSSYQLEWVHEFRPRVACVTNITPDHFDRHPDFEDYRQTKLRLFAQMGLGDTAVLLKPDSADIAAGIPAGCAVVEAGVSDDSGWWVEDERYELADFNFLGRHNAANAATAGALAVALTGKPARDMIQGLKTFGGIEHRMESLGQLNGKTIINNSMCTNPAAMLASVSGFVDNSVLMVNGTMKGLDYDACRQQLIEKKARIVLFGAELPGTLQQAWKEDFPGEPDLESAFSHALNLAKDGENVILCPGGASVEPYANFRERGEAFKALVESVRQG